MGGTGVAKCTTKVVGFTINQYQLKDIEQIAYDSLTDELYKGYYQIRDIEFREIGKELTGDE